ncbi:MAG: alpha/beta hydrolase [Candidatus Eremiobacteraeota bacterium]|nr:alpha/beta hydrolase [Candidatus Eremiobacteraeota bacterium]
MSNIELEIVRIPPRNEGLPTLVFLHEGLGSVALWKDFPEAIARRTGCGALTYSRYGNGFSPVLREPRQPAYMHDEALEVLPELFGSLEIADAILIGHSDGASIALIYAAYHPKRVRGLVLMSPHLFVEELSLRSIAAIRGEYETTDLPQRMARYHCDADRTFYGWNDIWLSPQFRDWNIEEEASRVAAPILAIQGLDDEYGTPAQLDSLAARGKGRVDRLLLGDCKHSPQRERPALMEATIVTWIAEVGNGAQ